MDRKNVIIGASCFVAGFLAGMLFAGLFLDKNPGDGNRRTDKRISSNAPSSEEIIKALDTANRNPQDIDAVRRLANLYFRVGNLEEAVDWYTKVLVLNPHDTEVLLNRGFALWKSGKTNEALDAYRLAVRSAPEDYRSWYNIAIILSDLGRLPEARASLERVSKLNPGFKGLGALEQRISELERNR